jgi:hypothetical protein
MAMLMPLGDGAGVAAAAGSAGSCWYQTLVSMREESITAVDPTRFGAECGFADGGTEPPSASPMAHTHRLPVNRIRLSDACELSSELAIHFATLRCRLVTFSWPAMRSGR